jgi:hypothetical protein
MTQRKQFTSWFTLGIVLLALFFMAGVAMNRNAMTTVAVQLKPGVEEPGDHHILGIGADDKLPDYELRFRDGDDWHSVGLHPNQSAADGLEFPLKNPWPLRRVEEIQFIENDHLENDVLEQLPVQAGKLSGKAFEFEIVEASSWTAGAQWFWDTAIGKAFLFGITLGVAAIVIAKFGM